MEIVSELTGLVDMKATGNGDPDALEQRIARRRRESFSSFYYADKGGGVPSIAIGMSPILQADKYLNLWDGVKLRPTGDSKRVRQNNFFPLT